MRSDTRRNKQQLLRAVAEEVRNNPQTLSMQSVAIRAEVGVTSAYRYFSGLDELLSAYMLQLMEELEDFSAHSPKTGTELFQSVLSKWVGLVLEHGNVMVQLRSRSGYLERLDRLDPVINTSRRIWERPLQGLLGGQEPTEGELRRALSLCNVLTDPREILDLHQTDKHPPEQITSTLTQALSGALSRQLRHIPPGIHPRRHSLSKGAASPTTCQPGSRQAADW